MGYYEEYLNAGLNADSLNSTRKEQLKKISELRGDRDIIVYGTDMAKTNVKNGIWFEDRLPFFDQLSNLSGTAIDVIIHTPGGMGETVFELVEMLRDKYEDVAFIIPGQAMSAGTIMVMSGNEILMGPESTLGPIDAQLAWKDRGHSADAFLKGLERIKAEVEATKILPKVYIPMLSNLSPGDIENAENAQEFGRILVEDWLVKYKFKNWDKHSKSGKQVTEKEKKTRAKEIAKELSKQSKWKTHARPIRLPDLIDLGIQITNYQDKPELCEAIRRYYTLFLMFMASTPVYKIYETVSSQIVRMVAIPAKTPEQQEVNSTNAEIACQKCGNKSKIKVKLVDKAIAEKLKLENKREVFACPSCGEKLDLKELTKDFEKQTGKKVIYEE